MQRPLSQRGLFGLSDSIRIEALDRDAGRFSCQLEQLEPKKVLAVDVDLTGTVLTVSFDDQADDEVFLAITSTGYEVNGANSTSGIDTITKLVVTDAGTAKTSRFVLTEASQNLTGGLTIGSNVADAAISSEVKTAGGNVTIDSPNLTLAANISSGGGSQTYGGAVVLANDVTLLTGDGGANVPVRIEFQGTVDSDDSARTLNVRSEAIYARAAIGGTSELTSYLGETLGDDAEGGQSYRSVTTIGTQNYQAATSSGDVEFNGTYTTSDSDINLLGEGSYGVYLSLVGDTAIDVGAGSFTVQRNGGKGGSIFSDGGPFNLSIDAARVDVPIGIGVDPTGNSATPQINVLSFPETATKIGARELVATGGIQATGPVVPLVDIELLSGSGAINLAGGINNYSMAVTLGDANQTGSIFVKGIQARELEIGTGAFDIELNGTNFISFGTLSPPTKFLNTGNLTLVGSMSFFWGGVEAPNVANTFVAGCVATHGKDISLANVTILESVPTRFDTQFEGQNNEGGNIAVSNLKNNTSQSVDFDIGNGTPNTLTLSGTTESTGELIFRGVGNVNVAGDATLADAVRAQNLLTGEAGTRPSLAFAGNVTLTGAMEFEGITATFANGIEGAGNDLTIDFTQTTAVDGFANVANFTSKGATELNGVFTTSGYQWYRDSVDLLGDTNLVASTLQFDIGVTVDADGNNVTLTPSESVTLASGTLSDVNALTIAGDLRVLGDLQAKTIDVQGNVTLLGDSLLRGDGSGTTVNLSLAQNATFTGLIGDSNLTYGLILSPDGSHGVYLDFGTSSGIGGGISIYDLSNPLLPVRLTQASTGNTTITEGAAAKGRGAVWSADGSRLYIAGIADERVTVFDSSDPANLSRLGGVSNTTFPSNAWVPALANDTTLVVTSTGLNSTVAGGLTILDASDPTNLSVVANTTQVGVAYGPSTNNWVTTSADGDYAYYVGNTSMQIVDISDPANPFEASSTNVSLTVGTPWTIAVTGGTAFVGGTDGYAAYDVSDPGNVSATPLSSQLTDPIYGFALSPVGEELYTPVFGNVTTNTVTAWDILVPEFPQSRGQLPSNVAQVADPGQFNRVSVHPEGEALYVNLFGAANKGQAGFAVFEIPTEPRPGDPGAVTIAGDIDGGFNLTLDAGVEGNVTITGDIGSNAPLAGLSVIGSGFDPAGDVSLTGDLAVSGLVTLASDSTISANAAVLSGGIEGACHSIVLNVAQFTLDAAGVPFSNVADLTITGDASLNGTIATSGNQSYGGDVTLLGDTTLTSGAGAINASAGVSGAGQNLTVGDANQTGAVTLGGGITLGSLTTGAGDFDVTVTALNPDKTTVTGVSEFLNNGTVSLLADGQFQSFEGGLNASAAQAVRVAGGVATTNAPLSLNNVTAVDTIAKISTTGGQDVGSNGSTLTINGLELNGATVTTYGGTTGETVLTGAVNLSAGTLSVAAGDLALGSGGTGATLTATDTETVAVAANYEISLAAFTTLSAAGQTVNFKADDFLISSAPDSLTAGCLTFSTATAGTNFALGANKGTKGDVVLSQADFDSFNASRVEIGQSGSSGNINMGALTLDGPRLDLWANGGGSVAISGAYDGTTSESVSLYVHGSDNGTEIAANITSNSAVVIADSVEITADVTIDTTSGNASITLLGGMPGGTAAGIYADAAYPSGRELVILAGTGTVYLGGDDVNGNLAGFTDNGGSAAPVNTIDITAGETRLYGTSNEFEFDWYINGPMTLANPNNVDILITGGSFIMNGTIDSAANTTNSLTLEVYGNSDLEGAVGDTVPLGNLTDQGTTSVLSLYENITTLGDQTWKREVQLAGDVTFTGNAGSFLGGLNAASNDLVLNFSNLVTIDGSSTFANVGNLTSVGPAAVKGTIATSGSQTYSGNVSLIGATTLQGSAAVLSGAIAGGNNPLTLNFSDAVTVLDGGIANVQTLTALTDVDLAGAIQTSGDQNYAANVTLIGSTSLEGNAATSATGVSGGGNDLSINFTQASLDGLSNINNFTSLGGVELNGTFTTTGFQNYAGPIALLGDTSLNPTQLLIGGSVTGNNHNLTLSQTAGPITLSDAEISGVNLLDIVSDANLSGNLGAVEVTMQGNVALTGDTVATASGQVRFFKTIDGPHSLTTNASAAVFNGLVGSDSPLANFGVLGDAYLYNNITVTGEQDFDGNVTLQSDVTLSSNKTLITQGLNIDGAEGNRNLTIDADETAVVIANVSGIAALSINSRNMTLGGVIETTGNQTYNATDEFGFDATLLSGGGDIVLGSENSQPKFAGFSNSLEIGDENQTGDVQIYATGTVTSLVVGNGSFDISIDTNADLTFNDKVDFLNNGSVSIATGAAESSCVSFTGGLNATAVAQVNLFGSVRTAGNPINLSTLVLNNGGGYPYALGVLDTTNGGSAPVGASITIESLNVSGGGFGFETGANNVLTLTGSSDLNGSIILGDGSIEATGDVVLGGSIQIAGDQNYAANVTLGRATTLTGNTATFANALEGAGNDLTINFTQTSTIDGFNNVHNFTSLSAVELNGSFSTTGAQNYAGPVTLVGDTTLVDQASTRFTLDYGNMSVAGNLSGIGQARAIATSSDGQYAFIAADSGGLQVVNIADPANQTVVGNASTADVARDVVLSADGQYAYVAVFLQGVEIYDVSNVSAPTLVGSRDTEKAVGLSLSTDGQHLFVADGNVGGLRILDVSDPANPVIVGTKNTGGFAVDVTVSTDGQRAYVADQSGGLLVMDVSNVAAPTQIGNLTTDESAIGVTLSSDGQYVFVADSIKGLMTVDVSNGSSPQEVTTASTSLKVGGSVLSEDGNYLFVLEESPHSSQQVGGIQVLDISDVANQTVVGTLSLATSATGLSFVPNGEYAYVSASTGGLDAVLLGTIEPEAGSIRFGSEVSGNHTLTVGDANTTGEVEFGGNTAIASLVSAPGNFNVSLTGTNNTLGAANFQHTGVLGIGNDETDRTFVPGGITAPNVALSQLGGTFATNGSAITFNDISLLANATLDATNNNLAPAGANVLISGGLTLNSYTLVTKTGTSATQAEGDVTIQNGTVKVEQGSLDIGVGNTSANVTFVQNTTVTVAAGGQLNVGNGSSLTAGNNTLTLTTDVLNVSPTAGNITGSAVTITPATPGNSIHAGNATGSGLLLPQSTINKMQTPVLTLGGAGYNGTIEVQGLTGAFDRLNLIANGTGGAIDLSGGLNLSGKGDDGVSLFIQGSGATTDLSGPVNLAGAAKIYDAVQLTGDASILSTGGNVTITGGNTGIYSQSGNSYNLSIDAGIVVLGNQTGFGDNSGSDSFVGDLTVNATSTTVGNATQQIDGTLTVTGTNLNLEGSVGAADGINVAVTGTTTVVNNVELTTTGGGIGILGNIAGPGSLNISAATNVSLGATAGDTGSELAALTVFSANGSIAAVGAATTGSQQFALGNQTQSVSIRGSYATDNSSLSFNVGNAAVVATGNVLLSTGSGNISVSGDLLATNAGSESLTVNSTGVATFGGAVGNGSSSATSFFSLFTTDAGGTAQFAGNVVSLGIALNSDVELLGNVTFAGLGGAFNGSVDGGGFGVQFGFVETAVDGARWSNLASLRFESGTIGLSNTITTTGLQEYNGSVVLNANTTLVAGADGVSLLGAVDGSTSGNQSLVINTTGVTNLAGNIGAITPLASLTTNAGGNTTIAGPSVITTGNQSYGDAVVLSGDVELRGQAGQFAAGVEGGGNDLTLNFAATTALDGNFVNITNLSSEGAVTLNGAITTLGNQTYGETLNLAAAVVLTGDVGSFPGVQANGNDLTLNFSSGISLQNLNGVRDLLVEGDASLEGLIVATGSQNYAANVTLTNATTIQANVASVAGTITGNNNDLTLNIATTVTIDGDATLANLANLTVLGAAELDASIQTSGVQNFAGPVTLLGSTDLTGLSGLFTGGIAGNSKALTLNYSQTTTIDGTSVFSNIGDFTVVGDADLNATIQTTGLQSYGGVTTLLGDTTLNTGGTGNVSFGSTVDGANRLDIEAGSGRIEFFGALGGTTPLPSLNLTSASAVTALSNFAINGTGAGSDGLLIGTGVSNVNIAQPGSTITNANLAGIRFAGGSQNSTVGGFTITGSGGSGVAVEPGDYTGSVFASSTLTGSGGDGLRARNTTGLTVRDTRSSGNSGSGLWFEGAETTGVVVSNNSLGIDAAGSAAQPNVNFGLMLYGVSGGEVANNTIGGNTRYGVVVETAAANVVVSDNLIGTNENGDSLGNGNDGILVKDATNVAVTGNRIANNEYYGIQVYNSQNVTVGGSIAAQQGNVFLNNRQYGIALRLDLTGTVVQGNYIDSGEEAGIYISSAQNVTVGSVSADLANEVTGYDHGIMAGGDCSGTIVVGNNIHDNVIDGVRLLEAQNLTVLRNAVRDNGLYGSLAVGDNTGTQLGGNTIDGHGTGVWVVDGYGLAIGSETGTDPAETVPGDSSLIGNVIANNTGNGIVIQINDADLPSINNTILSNSIYSNGIFGIQMYGPTELFVAPPSLSGATLDEGTGEVSVTGSVQGIEGETYRIQYFKSSANVTTSSRYAQGETLVAYQDVVINGGSASIDLLISSLANVIATDWITTTSTLLSGGTPSRTSAFSFGVRVTA